jgi:type VI secretion system secreted protein VgrG
VNEAADGKVLAAELKLRSGEASLVPVQVSAREAVSEPFAVQIYARSPRSDVDLGAIVGYGGALRLTEAGQATWTGVVSAMEVVHAARESEGISTYWLEIVPKLWLMRHRVAHRIFQHKTAADIAKTLLDEWKIAHVVELADQHPQLEYRVQYGESDLAFFDRLLEEAGIFYWFRFQDGETKLVLKDKLGKKASLSLLARDEPDEARDRPYAARVRLRHESRPGRVTLRDFDFRRPEHLLVGDAKVPDGPEASWQRYAYDAGGFLIEKPDRKPVADDKGTARHDDAEGSKRAARRLAAARFKKRAVAIETQRLEIGVGAVFAIEGHDHPALDGAPLVCIESAVTTTATNEAVVQATAVYAEDPFRVPLRTPRPRIGGVQSAIVVGPDGKEAHTDELGRVRVRFHWDRAKVADDDRTCWLRLGEGWAGTGFGTTLIPRPGHEVLVAFVEGDPDQPVVVGRMHNVPAPHPYKLADSDTKSVWKTQTVPFADDAYNELMMEDTADKELVLARAQRNWMSLVKQHDTRRVKVDALEVTGEHRLAIVGRVDATEVGGHYLAHMVKPSALEPFAEGSPEAKLRSSFLRLEDGKIELTVGGASLRIEGGDVHVQADGGIRLSSDAELTMKASKIWLNCSAAMFAKASADAKPDDAALRETLRESAVMLAFTGPPPPVFEGAAAEAAGWQGSGKYPGVDHWKNETLKKGTIVYGGVDKKGNPSGFFIPKAAVDASGGSKEKLWQGLQVQKHPTYGYREKVVEFVLTEDVPVATASTTQNLQFGDGGAAQIYAPPDAGSDPKTWSKFAKTGNEVNLTDP